MKFLKLGIISVVVLFLLATAMTSLLPSSIIVSRAIDVSGKPDSAMAFIRDLETWKLWVHQQDSANSWIVRGDKQVELGSTTVTLISTSKDKLITEWQTGEGTPMQSQFNVFTSGDNPVYTVQWEFTQKVKWYPWEKLALIVSDKAMGPFMEKSLDNLKLQLENTAAP